MAPRSKLAALVLLLAVNLILVLVVVAAVELTFGNWFRPYVPPAVAVVDRSYTYRQEFYDPPGNVRYVRDKYGLRGVQDPISSIEIAAVGGSTTDQRYISEGKTWNDVMRESCGARIINAGADGMSSFGHIVAVSEWLHRIPDFRPKYYLHYIGVNDASLGAEPRIADLTGTRTPLLRELRRRSIIATTLENFLARLGPPREIVHGKVIEPGEAPSPMRKVTIDASEIARFVEVTYKRNLRSILELHRQRHELAVFASQPAHPSIVAWRDGAPWVSTKYSGLERWVVALHMINRATESVCKENSRLCHFSDVAAQVQFGADDFYDLVHLTPAGARKVGMYLCQDLASILRGH